MAYRVFMSYSWANSAERFALEAEISKIHSIDLIVDAGNIGPGDEIHKRIDELLAATDCVIAFLTEEGLRSHEVLDELVRVHDRGKFIIPIVGEGTSLETLPWFLRDRNFISYNGRNFDQVAETVINALIERANPLDAMVGGSARLRELAASGARFIDVLSSDAVFTSMPEHDYGFFELRIRESSQSFIFRAPVRMSLGEAAGFLAREILPGLARERYRWSFIHRERELSPYQTFETASIHSGATVSLKGTHEEPDVAPKMGN